jgi:hypothetical protein
MVSVAQRGFYSLSLRPLSVKRHLTPLSLTPFLSHDAYFLVPLCQCLVAGALSAGASLPPLLWRCLSPVKTECHATTLSKFTSASLSRDASLNPSALSSFLSPEAYFLLSLCLYLVAGAFLAGASLSRPLCRCLSPVKTRWHATRFR